MGRGFFCERVFFVNSVCELSKACASHGLAGFQQNAADDLQAAVGLELERIQRFPRNAVGVDDVNLLGDPAVGDACLAEFETSVPIDPGILLPNHRHNNAAFWNNPPTLPP